MKSETGKQMEEGDEAWEDPKLAWKGLWEISIKLRGISYLVSNQGEDPALPLDLGEIQEGIGMLLEELAQEVREIWRTLDEAHVAKSRATKSRRSS